MQEQHIRHLAIVEEGALIGMISFRDVLDAELAEAEQPDPAASM
jgi:CBS domain-containing protein